MLYFDHSFEIMYVSHSPVLSIVRPLTCLEITASNDTDDSTSRHDSNDALYMVYYLYDEINQVLLGEH